jgi:hypothetical protein
LNLEPGRSSVFSRFRKYDSTSFLSFIAHEKGRSCGERPSRRFMVCSEAHETG